MTTVYPWTFTTTEFNMCCKKILFNSVLIRVLQIKEKKRDSKEKSNKYNKCVTD